MSTQTEHLGLHQWEAGDSFLRSDFNEDFAKIDAGVKAADARVAEAKGMATAVEAKLDEFIAAGSCVTGSHAMAPGTDITVHLGFRPKLLILIADYDRWHNMAISFDGVGYSFYYDGSRSYFSASNYDRPMEDDGFIIGAKSAFFNGSSSGTVHYFALR